MRQYEKAAELLSRWMRERSVAVRELAGQTGIDPGTLRRILTGRQRAISTRNMLALARFFDIPLQELMDKLA